jgi:hypothetical protein
MSLQGSDLPAFAPLEVLEPAGMQDVRYIWTVYNSEICDTLNPNVLRRDQSMHKKYILNKKYIGLRLQV